MDTLTHALTAALIAYVIHLPQLLPFFVLGAVIPDTDILFAMISDRHPKLYLFIHGGITHSIAGVAVLSVIAWTTASFTMETGLVRSGLTVADPASGFTAVLAGAILHICLDSLATPGLPLLAPFSDRKYTAGLLPGPSLLLMAASLFFLILLDLGVIGIPAMVLPYVMIITAYLAFRLVAFCIVRMALFRNVRAVPTINPLRWLVIGETPGTWTIGEYRIGKGMGQIVTIQKYRSTDAGETSPFCSLPEIRRLVFHSYIVTAEKEGTELIFSDPLRTSGRIFYPPHHFSVRFHLPYPASPHINPEVP